LQRPQKIIDFPFPAPVLNAVFDAVPVVRLKGIGSPPISAPTCGGGQSWLVGYSGWPARAESAGVHDAPSFGPPLHLLVVELQIGQGWTFGSLAHSPGAQLVFVVHKVPAVANPTQHPGQVAPGHPVVAFVSSVEQARPFRLPPEHLPLHRFGKRSAVR